MNITAHTSWLMGTFMFYLWLHGTAGHIFVDVRYDITNEIHGMPNPIDDTYTFLKNIIRVGKNILNKRFFLGALQNYPSLIKDFIRSVIERKKRGLLTTIDEESNRIFVLEAAFESIKRGGVPISWEDLINR